MPPHPGEPLRKVTLNLYESDCAALERRFGHGWSTVVREWIHLKVATAQPRTLADLAATIRSEPHEDD